MSVIPQGIRGCQLKKQPGSFISWPLKYDLWIYNQLIYETVNWSIKLALLIRFKRILIIITLMFWIFNKEFQLGPQPETIIIIIITIWSLPTLYPFYLSLSTSHSLPPTTYSLSHSSLFCLSHLYIPSTLFISLLPTLVLHLYLIPSHSHSLSFISALLFLCVPTCFYYPLSSLPYLTHPLSLPKLQPTLPSELLILLLFHLDHLSSSFPSHLSSLSLPFSLPSSLPCFTLRDNGGGVQWWWCSMVFESWCWVVVSRLTWAIISDLRVVNFGTRTAKHQSHNWGIQIINGCSLKLCVAAHSVVSSSTAPQTKLNANARLFRDGSIRKYQFTFTFHTTLQPLLTLFIMSSFLVL